MSNTETNEVGTRGRKSITLNKRALAEMVEKVKKGHPTTHYMKNGVLVPAGLIDFKVEKVEGAGRGRPKFTWFATPEGNKLVSWLNLMRANEAKRAAKATLVNDQTAGEPEQQVAA